MCYRRMEIEVFGIMINFDMESSEVTRPDIGGSWSHISKQDCNKYTDITASSLIRYLPPDIKMFIEDT